MLKQRPSNYKGTPTNAQPKCSDCMLKDDKGISAAAAAAAPFQRLENFAGNLVSRSNLDKGSHGKGKRENKNDRNKVEEDMYSSSLGRIKIENYAGWGYRDQPSMGM